MWPADASISRINSERSAAVGLRRSVRSDHLQRIPFGQGHALVNARGMRCRYKSLQSDSSLRCCVPIEPQGCRCEAQTVNSRGGHLVSRSDCAGSHSSAGALLAAGTASCLTFALVRGAASGCCHATFEHIRSLDVAGRLGEARRGTQ